MALGYAVGWARGRAVLRAYQAGLRDEHERMRGAEGQGGSCWVKAQVEARAIELSEPPDRLSER